MPDMTKIASSNIDSIGYEKDSSVAYVTFYRAVCIKFIR